MKYESKYEEKDIMTMNGLVAILIILGGYILAVGLLFFAMSLANDILKTICLIVAISWISLAWIGLFGIKIIKPKEAMVLTLFGKYKGSLKEEGIHFVNPFCVSINPAANTELGQSNDVKEKRARVSTNEGIRLDGPTNKKISLKIMTLNNNRQKVNDVNGNPVEIGIGVMWRITNTAQAVFNVDNYKNYLSIQTDSAVREIVKIYPYDVANDVDTTGDGEPDDGSLRGSSKIVAQRIKEELQDKVKFAGIEIVEARITHLAYSPEIAAAMLQRQQAKAVVDARRLIVDGAVGMVEMALEKLNDNQIVELDEERKAAMVSNLLVVLCGNKEAQPIVNSGSLY